MNIVKLNYLKELFGSHGLNCSNRSLNSLCDILTFRLVRKGQYIFEDSGLAQKVYLVYNGMVKIGILDNADDQVLWYVLTSGNIFAEEEFFGDVSQGYFAKAAADTYLLEVEQSQLTSLLNGSPELIKIIYKISWLKINKMKGRLNTALTCNAEERVLSFLENFVTENGILDGTSRFVANPFSHQDIGDLTSTCRQTVNNVISKYRKLGELEYTRQRISISDQQKGRLFSHLSA